MASVNKVILLGNLGKDPEVRYTPNGKAVCSASLATTERWGEGADKKEKTEWHNLVAWGKLGEVLGEYGKKGSSIYVEGRLQTRSWEDKDGNKKYVTEVNVTNLQLLSKAPASKGAPQAPAGPQDDIPF